MNTFATCLSVLILTGCTSNTTLQDVPHSHPASSHADEGMRAQPEHSPKASHETKEPVPEKKAYVCPMHPEVTSDSPGRCPKCGMNLEKSAGAHAH